MLPTHHVPHESLIDYVAGTAPQAVSLVIACHLTLCPACRRQMDELEALGGACLEQAPPRALDPGLLERTLQRLDNVPTPAPVVPAPWSAGGPDLPRPLLRHLTRDPVWRWVLPGVRAVDFDTGPGPFGARLIRFAPGLEIPQHDHGGDEYIVVFAGGISEAGAHYGRGDVSVRHPGEAHRQSILPDEPCVALVVNGGPLRPRTAKGWLIKWLARE